VPDEQVSPVSPEIRAVANEIARLDLAMFKRFYAGRRQVAGEVTPRMVTVLRHLAVTGPMTVGEQAEHLGLSPAAMSELTDRLEQRRLVERMRDDVDRRRVFVWLTEQGRDHLAGLPEPDDPLVRAVASMDPVDRRHLVEGLRALLAADPPAPLPDTTTEGADHDRHRDHV
jgi:DNA-binding MarR family transcriptional regulator